MNLSLHFDTDKRTALQIGGIFSEILEHYNAEGYVKVHHDEEEGARLMIWWNSPDSDLHKALLRAEERAMMLCAEPWYGPEGH
jgi:hypothetical protein